MCHMNEASKKMAVRRAGKDALGHLLDYLHCFIYSWIALLVIAAIISQSAAVDFCKSSSPYLSADLIVLNIAYMNACEDVRGGVSLASTFKRSSFVLVCSKRRTG